jgi:hypothetical protein
MSPADQLRPEVQLPRQLENLATAVDGLTQAAAALLAEPSLARCDAFLAGLSAARLPATKLRIRLEEELRNG